MRLLKKPLAQADLMEIWRYIAEDTPKQADAFLDALEITLQKLVYFLFIGRDRSSILNNVQSLPFKNYITSYRVLDTKALEILRILHAALDIKRLIENT